MLVHFGACVAGELADGHRCRSQPIIALFQSPAADANRRGTCRDASAGSEAGRLCGDAEREGEGESNRGLAPAGAVPMLCGWDEPAMWDLPRVKELSEAPADGQWPFSEC